MRIFEVLTSIGAKYEELYTQYYKRAHRQARQQGMNSADADAFAKQRLEKYKDNVRTGEWDPITLKKGLGKAEYK